MRTPFKIGGTGPVAVILALSSLSCAGTDAVLRAAKAGIQLGVVDRPDRKRQPVI